MNSVVFIGHRDCFGVSIETLEEIITRCIQNGAVNFYNGGQGGFDYISATAVYNLKKRFPHIKNYLVIPYLNFKVFNKGIFDEIIYPDGFEKYHYKAAIPARNKYMVKQCDTAICYINHNWGGATKTYEFAKKQKLKIINIE